MHTQPLLRYIALTMPQIQGYEILTSKAKSINDDLEQHYETFVDCADWKDATLNLLTEIANMTVSLKVCGVGDGGGKGSKERVGS